MRELQVVIKDDFYHSRLADRTISYTWGGVPLEIDLTAEHADEFEATMRPYVEVSRKAKRKKGTPKASTSKAAPSSLVSDNTPGKKNGHNSSPGKDLRDAVRAYAVENGISQARTGYLKQASIDLWCELHPEDREALEGTRP